VDVPHTDALVFGLMTSPVGSLSSVTFTDEVTVTSERLPPPARRERNTRADWPELRDDRLKVEIFQLGAKIAALKTRRLGKYRVCTLTFHGIRWREKIVSLLV